MEDSDQQEPLTRETRLANLLKSIPGYIDPASIDRTLTEVSNFGVELEADPTQAHLGTKYLHEVIAKCRNQLNRAHYYLQQMRMFEKGLRLKSRERELDLDMKMRGLLADDPIVRKQPSIDDRKALASSMLSAEHEDMAGLRLAQLEIENSVKLVKSAYDHLQRTSQDIRLQRQLVRDDRDIENGGSGGGLQRPSPKPDGTLPDGEAPIATDPLPDPKDLLIGREADDMPKPVNDSHARLIQDFMSSHPVAPVKPVEPSKVEPVQDRPITRISYEDLMK